MVVDVSEAAEFVAPRSRELRKRTAFDQDSKCVLIKEILWRNLIKSFFKICFLFLSVMAKLRSGYFEVKLEEERKRQRKRVKKSKKDEA